MAQRHVLTTTQSIQISLMTDMLEVIETEAIPAAVVRLTIPRDQMQSAFPAAVHEILDVVNAQGIGPAGPPFAYHFRFDSEVFDFEIGFPISGNLDESGRVRRGELPAAKVVRTIYRGDYDGLPNAWGAFEARIKADGYRTRDSFWERYLAGPESGDPAQYRTELAWLVE
jgi:effector-binding domain-containing protein